MRVYRGAPYNRARQPAVDAHSPRRNVRGDPAGTFLLYFARTNTEMRERAQPGGTGHTLRRAF